MIFGEFQDTVIDLDVIFNIEKFCGGSSGAAIHKYTQILIFIGCMCFICFYHYITLMDKLNRNFSLIHFFFCTWFWHADHSGGYLSLSIWGEGRHFEKVGSVRSQLINSYWYGHTPGGSRGYSGEGDGGRGCSYLQGTESRTGQDISCILET